MHLILQDEDVPSMAVEELRRLGHDVISLNDLALNNIGLPDDEVLEVAIALGRAVVTHNKKHYIRLHRITEGRHTGLIVCSRFDDPLLLAEKIHRQISKYDSLETMLIRINRDNK